MTAPLHIFNCLPISMRDNILKHHQLQRLGKVEQAFMYSMKVVGYLTTFNFPILACFTIFRYNSVVDTFTGRISNYCNNTVTRRGPTLLPRVIGGYCSIDNFICGEFLATYISLLICSGFHFRLSYLYVLWRHICLCLQKCLACHWRRNIHEPTEIMQSSVTSTNFSRSYNISNVYIISISSTSWWFCFFFIFPVLY